MKNISARLLPLLICAVLLFTALTACGSRTDNGDENGQHGALPGDGDGPDGSDGNNNHDSNTPPQGLLENPETDFTFEPNADGVTIIGYSGSSLRVRIPDTIDGLPVTSIGRAFDRWSLTEVFIPNSVTSIGDGAFAFNPDLTAVTLPVNLLFIGDGAFMNTGITSITFPNGLTTIGYGAFWGTNLTSVTIPDSVSYIGNEAFSSCSGLTNITIPNSVSFIGNSAFCWCDSLVSINVDRGNPDYMSADGVLFNKTQTTLIQYPKGNKRSSYSILSGVTSICEYAFADCINLTNITIPNSVTSIGDNAFCFCSNLIKINIPNSVTYIGDSAFSYCSSLTKITIPNSVTSIEAGTFSYCDSLTSITIPNSVTSIGDNAFDCCVSLPKITIPGSVTSIGDSAFYYCWSMISVMIPVSVTYIGNSAFSCCSNLVVISVDRGNPEYMSADGVLFNKNQTTLIQYPNGNNRSSYTIPNGVSSIGDEAFRECNRLTGITIPNSVTYIGDAAFCYCANLISITIPDGATYIGDSAFGLCASLESITIPNSVIYIGAEAFSECWSLTSITIPSGVTSISDNMFYYCSSLKSITIPNSVAYIGDNAFYYCSDLTSVTIPDGVTCIGDWAFCYCISLSSIMIPNSVLYIGYEAFSSCSDLVSITVESSNPYYLSADGVLFDKNQTTLIHYPSGKKLSSYTIPSRVTSIGDNSFADCNSLIKITIPNNVDYIGDCAFWHCSGLTSITIPNSVISIGDWAFENCISLTSITIPESVTSIGYGAFHVYDDTNQYLPVEGLTIIGRVGTYAETYAIENGIPFAIIVDAPSSWAVEEVEAAIVAGLVPVNLQRNYQYTVTRGEVAQIFINLIEKAADQDIDSFLEEKGVAIDENAFTDTTDRDVLAANALGIIKGIGDNKFDPDGVFMRAHIAVIINRVARVLGEDTDGYTHGFTDVEGHWVDSELGWPVHADIIQGIEDNRFDPDADLTTEMVITITYRALTALSE